MNSTYLSLIFLSFFNLSNYQTQAAPAGRSPPKQVPKWPRPHNASAQRPPALCDLVNGQIQSRSIVSPSTGGAGSGMGRQSVTSKRARSPPSTQSTVPFQPKVTRGEYDYYICTEVDYMPVRTRYDALLVDIHRSLFGHKLGALMGFLQGRPAEPHSHYALHGQNEFVLSLAALDRLYEYLFGEVGWTGSTADRMSELVLKTTNIFDGTMGSLGHYSRHRFDRIQEGFGMLLTEAGVGMADSSAIYRHSYWNGQSNRVELYGAGLHDSFDPRALNLSLRSSLPMDKMIVVPAPMLFLSKVFRCCGLGLQSCKAKASYAHGAFLPCNVDDWRNTTCTDCCDKRRPVDGTFASRSKSIKTDVRCSDVGKWNGTGLYGVPYSQLRQTNCSLFGGLLTAPRQEPYADSSWASCVLTQAPAWVHTRVGGWIHSATSFQVASAPPPPFAPLPAAPPGAPRHLRQGNHHRSGG